jgi:hypothetical protein
MHFYSGSKNMEFLSKGTIQDNAPDITGRVIHKMSDREWMQKRNIRAATILFHNMAGISRKNFRTP